MDEWTREENNPIDRFHAHLCRQQGGTWWSTKERQAYAEEIRGEILKKLVEAERRKKPALDGIFTDVYKEMPWNLCEQQAELRAIISEHPETYKALADRHVASRDDGVKGEEG